MSHPVYVCDAERPLHPTAPAYARVLLRTGHARRIAHPALSIIQLTRPVAQPTISPVVLAARLHGPLAELFLVRDRAGQPVVLHRLLLDLALSADLCPDPVDSATILSGVQRGLGRLLPITQMIVQQVPVPCPPVVQAVTAPTSAVDALVAALPALHAQTTHRPALIAVWVAPMPGAPHTPALGPSRYVLPQPVAAVGAVARLAHGGSAVTGLITAVDATTCTVQAPVATDAGLVWQAHHGPTDALLRVWRRTEAAILPLG
ncbi:MAG: hypothetical protein WCG26_09785, partial [Chloroflexales bacterium]